MARRRRSREGPLHLPEQHLTRLRYGLAYFLAVFGAGFALAPLRELVLAPRIGPVAAELAEFPVMAAVIWLVAGWVARRPALAGNRAALLTAGLIALGLMLAAEAAVVILVRGMSLADYVTGRDPLTGSVYLVMLAVFGLLPALRGAAERG